MTRHQNKHNDSIDGSNDTYSTKRVENSWILLIQESLLENNEFNFIRLPHPAHSKPTKFCLDETHKKIYEMVTFSESHRCWFFGYTVKSDSSMLFLTSVNPIFLDIDGLEHSRTNYPAKCMWWYWQLHLCKLYPSLRRKRRWVHIGTGKHHQYLSCHDIATDLVLPYLRKQCNTRAMPLKDLSSNKGFEKIVDFVNNFDIVADLKGPPDLKAYKYNETKTLLWIENKVTKLAKTLKEKNIHVTSGAVSATFVASTSGSNTVDEVSDFYLKYALGMIAEYVENDIIELLRKKLNLKADFVESLGKKRKSEVGESYNKRIKFETKGIESSKSDSATHVLNDVNKPKTLSAKEKALQRAASGTKTISTFFTKK